MFDHLSLDAISQVRRARPAPLTFSRSAQGFRVSGYALQWAVADDHGSCCEPDGWANDHVSGSMPLIRQHNPDIVLGSCQIVADAEGLYATGTIDDFDQFEAVAADLKLGRIGAMAADILVPYDAAAACRGRAPVTIAEWKVAAVSLVENRPEIRRAHAGQGPITLRSKAELVDLLRATGLARGAAERIAASGWNGLTSAVAPTAPGIAHAIDAITKSLEQEGRLS